MESSRQIQLQNVLSEKQLRFILRQIVGPTCHCVGSIIKPASDGMSGFLGDHFKVTLLVENGTQSTKLHLFVKTVPMMNKPKAEFIHANNYFRREAVMFKLIDDIKGAEGLNPWCAKAYIYNKNMIVMPDLTFEGYMQREACEYLDLDHVLTTVSSIAQFHASIANYLTKKSENGSKLCKIIEGFEYYLEEPTFNDSLWLKAAAKLTVNFLKEFSDKFKHLPSNFDEALVKLYIKACDILNENNETLNVLIHKDLWVNNILFRYENNVPKNAILIDYQCSRFAPPAFDIMIFLYLTTSKSFRKAHEKDILEHYFSIFSENVDDLTKERLLKLDYNFETFKNLCNKARMFGILEAITIFPYVLMDSQCARTTFDDPNTYMKYLEDDRSEPVLAYARRCSYYRNMQLEVSEEFIERYALESYQGTGNE